MPKCVNFKNEIFTLGLHLVSLDQYRIRSLFSLFTQWIKDFGQEIIWIEIFQVTTTTVIVVIKVIIVKGLKVVIVKLED